MVAASCYIFYYMDEFIIWPFGIQSLSAYMGKRLSGKVIDTFVRGNLVFKDGKHAAAACGVQILAKWIGSKLVITITSRLNFF